MGSNVNCVSLGVTLVPRRHEVRIDCTSRSYETQLSLISGKNGAALDNVVGFDTYALPNSEQRT